MSIKNLYKDATFEINVKDVNTIIRTWDCGDINAFGNIISAPNFLYYTIVNQIVTLYAKLPFDDINNATTTSVTFANPFPSRFSPQNQHIGGACVCDDFGGDYYLGTFNISDEGVLQLNFPTISLTSPYRVNCLMSWQFLI